ncbi:MAG: hypothetical protein NZ519_14080, partial [Bacteroidia bacterium]|nr:hypothetical protein [Bacteroidia bacterium]
MKIRLILTCILLVALWNYFLYADGVKDPVKKRQAEEWLSKKNESGFLENRGQMMDIQGNPVPFVLFRAQASNVNLWITEKGVTLQTLKIEEEEEKDFSPYEKAYNERTEHQVPRREERTEVYWERVDIELRGANIRKENIVREGAS